MSNLVSFEVAMWTCVVTYVLLLAFHLVIIVGAGILSEIPIHLVWGGKLKTRSRLVAFEAVALVVTTGFLVLTLIHSGMLSLPLVAPLSGYAMWGLSGFFALNTLGNLLARTTFEKSLSVATAVLSVATLRLAL